MALRVYVCVTRSGRVAFLRRWHKNAECVIAAYVTQGVALGYGQQLGFQPAPIVLGRVPL